jgi:hypothetical protein
MRLLKQSTAASVLVFMTDSADHISGKASLTLTITASKNGAAFASISPTVNDRGTGWYEIQLTTAHTDTLGDFALHITSAGADPTDTLSYVVVRHLADLTWPTTTGRSIDVDATGGVEVGAIGADVITATSIEAGAITSSEAPALANLDAAVSTRSLEAGGNLATVLGRVIGTIATGTHQPQSGDAYAQIGVAGASLTALGDTRISNLDAAVSSRVAPTIAARTLDIDTAGNVVVGAIEDGVIQSGTFNTGAITATAIEAGAIGASEAPLLANLDATVSSRAIPGDLMGLANDAITAAKIAAGAITSSEAPALANLDATVSSRAVAGDSMALTSAAVDAVLDEVVEGTMTFRQMLRIFLAALALKSAGGGTATISFRDQADSKNRISVTVDASNNRTAIGTLDGT